MPLTRDPNNPCCALEAPALIAPPAAYHCREFRNETPKERTHLNKEGNDIRSDIYASDYPTVDNEVLIGTQVPC